MSRAVEHLLVRLDIPKEVLVHLQGFSTKSTNAVDWLRGGDSEQAVIMSADFFSRIGQ